MEPLRGHFHRGSMGATGETTCPIYSLDVTLAPKRVSHLTYAGIYCNLLSRNKEGMEGSKTE